jgi:glycosyltransferase involved in cell wall biosynthesis
MISYDGNSNTGRKNPKGSLDAFCRAFPEAKEDIGLVIKVLHCGEREKKLFEELRARYKNVYIIDRSLEKAEFNSLLKAVDAYISLHRAEGFGLVLAEAMFLGTALVATNYSANNEFMTADDSCLVPADIVEIKEDNFPYKKGCHWAEPDIDKAAECIRRLIEDKEYYKSMTEKAARDIENTMGKNRIELPNLTNYYA